MRLLRALFFALCLAAPAVAQFTTVTGTITDPNGLPYAFGTISPALVSSGSPKFTSTNLPYTPPNSPTGLSSNGSFTMNLADNTQLTPGGSTWTFTVSCGFGCIPVAGGKGPVSFVVTGITISGASQSITATLNAAALPLSNSAGAGVLPSGAALPALPCTAATLFSLNGASANNADIVYKCSGSNAGNFWQPMQVRQSLSQDDFGVKADGKYIQDGSITSGSNVLNCTNTNDCNFICPGGIFPCSSGGDNGKLCWANWAGATSANATATALPIGTITSVTDAQHAVCGTAANNAIATNTTTASIVWMSDDEAAMEALDAATTQQCTGAQMHGIIGVKKGLFNTLPTTCPATRPATASAYGSGTQTTTVIVLRPDFDFTTCTGIGKVGGGLPSCFGIGGNSNLDLQVWRNIQFTGFWVGKSTAAVALFANDNVVYDFVFGNFCFANNCPNANGYIVTNTQASQAWGGAESITTATCVNYASQTFFGPNFACLNGAAGNGLVVSSGTAKTINAFFSGSGNLVLVSSGATWQSDYDECQGNGAVQVAGTAYVNRWNAAGNCSAANNQFQVTATGLLYLQNSKVPTGAGNWATIVTGGKIIEEGGNVFSSGTIGGTGAASIFGTPSIGGTQCVSGNFAFTSGWGTSAITGTPVGDASVCAFAIQTTVSGAAGPVLTYTFPSSFAPLRAPICTLIQNGGTFTLSNPSHVVNTTTDVITFAGTPTATQTYNFVEECR